ncbi:hypothetical protein N0V88_004763 [Collariella sp. IMI 366227]|nr:hypothetical protein N0V88_004763 [Collariella sp. IMI 366227]
MAAVLGSTPEGSRDSGTRDTLPQTQTQSTIPARPVSDTPSTSSDLVSASLPPRPVPHASPPLARETHDQTDAFPDLPPVPQYRPLPSPRSGRSMSLAQISGPIKRKPLSTTASPAAVRFSSEGAAYADILADLPRPEQRFARSCSLDSPTLYEFPDHRSLLATSSLNAVDWAESPGHSDPSSPITERFLQPAATIVASRDTHLRNTPESNPATTQTSDTLSEPGSCSPETASLATQESAPYELDDLYSIPESPELQAEKRATVVDTNSKTMSMFSRKSPPPHLNLGLNNRDSQVTAAATGSPREPSNLNKPLPKSPSSSKLGALGWTASPSPSTATDFSDKSFSPLPSPESPLKRATLVTTSYATPITSKSTAFPNATEKDSLQYCEAYLSTPADSTASLGQLEEMEDELKAISAELASSIRREMDLEDLAERLQDQVNNPQAPGKRTSDYYSDSGYSSAKFSDYDQAKEEMSQIQRRADQERAQIRLELIGKLQEERSQRRSLDEQIQELSKKASQLDVAQIANADATNRIKELEATCEDLTRRLSQEREAKNNFEDLLGALKGELQTAADERDNLRDEIVPHLRARVEGLEAEATEHAKLTYDTTKMQQELQLLRDQNTELHQTTIPAEEALKMQEELQTLMHQNAELQETTIPIEKARELQQELQSVMDQNTELLHTTVPAEEAFKMQQELEFLRDQNAELHETTVPAEEASKLQQELQLLIHQNDELQRTTTPAEETMKLQEELQFLRAENAELKEACVRAEDTSKLAVGLQEELQLLRSQNAELKQTSMRAEDTSILQQEIQMLRSQNAELKQTSTLDSSMLQQEIQMLRSQNTELKHTVPRMSMGLARSASVTGGSFRKGRQQSISRSNTVRQSEPRDVLAERIKDVEAQRDALHSALKSLLERQELQNRENSKRIRQLEAERDRLLSATPKKAGYEREVSVLRDEISVLRRRAEEAIEQKWQVEKGLAGHSERDLPVTSASLEQAYHDLQTAYLDALERIKSLEETSHPNNETQLAISRLEQSLSTALSDRDSARGEAASYLSSLHALEQQHLTTEQDLASQLHASALRVEQLASQVRAQLEANASLRTRLADTIARGEAEQRVSTERIAGMQNRLRALEEQVVAAQTGAEERVARCEDEVARLKDAGGHQHLLRMGVRRGSSTTEKKRLFPPGSPLSPIFTNARNNYPPQPASPPPIIPHPPPQNGINLRRPYLRRSTTAPSDPSSLEHNDNDTNELPAQVDTLKGRVTELEGALASADAEMQEVVGRMGAAQAEVMRLQEEREEAVRETRRLQGLVEGRGEGGGTGRLNG